MTTRLNILTKQLTVMVLLTVVPLIIVGYLALDDARSIGYDSATAANELGLAALEDARAMGNTAIEDSTKALNELGEKIIDEKGRDGALAVKSYLTAKPMTVEQMKADTLLQKMATGKVGETGYLCLYECKTGIMRIHPNAALIDKDMSFLKAKIPSWWAIFEPSLACTEIKGYYDWLEPDGVTIRQKYMIMTPVEGTNYMVAATTYIDEFSKPVELTKQKISASIAETEKNIAEKKTETEDKIRVATEGVSTQNTIFTVTALAVVIVVLIGIITARSITVPVVELTNAANRVVQGDLDVKITVSSNDEIKDLAQAMEALVGSLKYFRKGEQK